MNADDERDLERWLALYRDCCAQSGVESLPDDEARKLARRFQICQRRLFEREFRLH